MTAALLAGLALALALDPPRTIAPLTGNATIRDMDATAVNLQTPARRVTFFPPLAAAYYTIDADASHVVAIGSFERRALLQGPLPNILPGLRSVRTSPTVGTDSAVPGDPEQILTLGSEAVFSWSGSMGALRALGTPVLAVKFDSDAVVVALWRLMAQVAGDVTRGQWLIERYDEQMADIVGEVNELHVRTAPRVLLLSRRSAQTWSAGIRRNLLAMDLHRLGAQNPADRLAVPLVDVEQLLTMNPDVILLDCCVGETPEDFYHNDALQALRAVQERRVYQQPRGTALEMVGLVEWPILLNWSAELLYPQALPARTRQRLREAYRDVFHYHLGDAELDRILQLPANQGSTFYARFSRP